MQLATVQGISRQTQLVSRFFQSSMPTNDCIFVQLSSHRRYIGAIFTTGGQLLSVCLKVSHGAQDDDPDVHTFFPNGATSNRLTSMPSTRLRLLHDWRVIFTCSMAPTPDNFAIQALYGRRWYGNIIVLKYSRENHNSIISVTSADLEFVIALVGMYTFFSLALHRRIKSS